MANSTARDSVTLSAGFVSGYFTNYTATITIKVTDLNDSGSNTLASASSNFSESSSAGIGNRGIVGTKILGGSDVNGSTADGSMNVNFGIDWNFDDDIASDKYDFKSTLIHKLFLAIGFGSTITRAGQDPFGTAVDTENGRWAPFDEFVADSSGALIDGNYAMDGTAWAAASVGGNGSSGLFFNGAYAKAANGNSDVHLYSPGTWSEGSFLHHLDDDFFTSDNLLIEAATGEGAGARSLSAIEVGIIKDIGFTDINASSVPEPSSWALILGMIGLGSAVNRRQRR